MRMKREAVFGGSEKDRPDSVTGRFPPFVLDAKAIFGVCLIDEPSTRFYWLADSHFRVRVEPRQAQWGIAPYKSYGAIRLVFWIFQRLPWLLLSKSFA